MPSLGALLVNVPRIEKEAQRSMALYESDRRTLTRSHSLGTGVLELTCLLHNRFGQVSRMFFDARPPDPAISFSLPPCKDPPRIPGSSSLEKLAMRGTCWRSIAEAYQPWPMGFPQAFIEDPKA